MKHFYQNIGENWFTYPNLYSRIVRESPNESKFVEVGAWKGRSACFLAVEIINSGKQISFDVVDTWQGSEEHIGYDILNEDGLFKEFIRNIEPVKQIINPIRMTSLEASSLYEDESLDFVFLDASHKYEDLQNDLKAWLPKIKKNGVLAGHDYESWPEVTRAVNDFFSSHDLRFQNVGEYCFYHKKD